MHVAVGACVLRPKIVDELSLPQRKADDDRDAGLQSSDPPAIWGSVDGFTFPATISGWALQRQGDTLLPGLHIEVLQGDTLIATGKPTGPRPDLTDQANIQAAFTLDCGEAASAEAFLAGDLVVRAVDAAGNHAALPFWDKTIEHMQHALTLRALQAVDETTAREIIAALSQNPNLPATTKARLAGHTMSAQTPPRRRAARAPKIVFVGAGSTVFAKNLLGDILLHPALAECEIRLTDIDAARLRVSEIVARRIGHTLSAPASVLATQDLGQALDGADYVFNMIQVGGYRPCTVTDFEVPKRFGLRQTIADTLGIGGIFRALRTIPVLWAMAEEMRQHCPQALHLNYVNPMAMNCWALHRRYPSLRTIGLCHSVQHTAAELAADLGLAGETLDYQVAGINHMAFYLKLEHAGEDLYPRLQRLAEEGRVPAGNRVRYEMLRRLGYFVTESSEHFAEYVPWFIKGQQPALIGRFAVPLDEYPRRCELQIAAWEALSRRLTDPSVPLAVAPSQEYGASIINAIETGVPTVIYGNVANDRLIDNLPEGCCVELPCLVNHHGVQPVRVGALPPQLAALMQTNINVQSLTVEAALAGRREHVYHAAMLDPHTGAELNLDQIEALVDAMFAAHRDWLPESFF
jgi:alpha-galactosidase